MAETTTFAGTPIWVDLSSSDAAASRDFYAKLFGWEVPVEADPAAGGYAMARAGGRQVAGIGPAQPGAPTAWTVYIGSEDAEATARKVEAAGGKVVAGPFDVMEAGRMAVFQDPHGAFIAVWQPKQMRGADLMNAPGSLAWVELNARGVEAAKEFYREVFGWTEKVSEMGEGTGQYTEFLAEGRSIAGAMEMNPMVPAEVPNYWQVYFGVEDVDGSFRKAVELGGHGLVEPMDYPGGRFAIVQDRQGGVFGLLKV